MSFFGVFSGFRTPAAQQPRGFGEPPAPGAPPDYLEPLIGWRLWVVDGDTLHSWTRNAVVWEPFEPLRSQHVDGEIVDTFCHGDLCTCGVNAFKQAGDLRRELTGYTPFPVAWPANLAIGTVALWGRVRVFERGYRAECGYPQSIVAVGDGIDGEALARDYGIDYKEDASWISVIQNASSSSNPFDRLFQAGGSGRTRRWTGLSRFSVPLFYLPDKWSSPILFHPDDVVGGAAGLVQIVDPAEKLANALPCLPAGMSPPDVIAPDRWRLPSGIYAATK